MKYFEMWIKDFKSKLEKYQNLHKEPYGYVKSYFVDSGLYLLDLVEFLVIDDNKKKIWNWLYHLGNHFAQYVSNEFFNRFNTIYNNQDLSNCSYTLQQMYIVFKVMQNTAIYPDLSIFERFFERVGGYIIYLKKNINDKKKQSPILYGCCISIQLFNFYLEHYHIDKSYRKNAINYYSSSIQILKQYLENNNIYENLPGSYGLWSFIYKITNEIPEFSDSNLLLKEEFEDNMVKVSKIITRFDPIPYVLDNARFNSKTIFKCFLERLVQLFNEYTYTGSHWNKLARFAKCEFYIKIYNNKDKMVNFIAKFPNFNPYEIPVPLFDMFIKFFFKIYDQIEGDSSIKKIIRDKTYKEENFRDFFSTRFSVSHDWIVDKEFKGKLDRNSDLRVIIPETSFRITIEYKIWKRNFDKYEPVQELLDNMGIHEIQGIIFMINGNEKPIEDKLINQLIKSHPKYYPGSFEIISLEGRSFPIFKAKYKNNYRLIEIYHIILNLFMF